MTKRASVRHTVHALLLTAALTVANPLPAFANEAHRFEVRTTDSAQAIQAFAVQSGLQIFASAEQLQGKKLHEVTGTLSTEDGLKTLLKDTGLTHRYVGERTVALVKEAPKSFWSRFRLAEADPATETDAAVESESSGAKEEVTLEEIVVTAQKRIERLQDVPVPVSTVSGAALTNSSQLRLEDYFSKLPGLGLVLTGDGGAPAVNIRGITTGGNTNPTVGVVIDELPYGATIAGSTPPLAPEVDPGDLARVEVLRGPQGTLYGASSIGGLLKYVTIDPSIERISGSLQTGSTSVKEGDDLGYSLRGSINLPVANTAAVRVSGFTVVEPGYVDNVQTGEQDVNETQSGGGRVAALWRPSESLSVKLNATVQKSERKGTAEVDSLLGDGLKQRAVPNSGLSNRDVQAYSATVEGRWANVDITSATGYSIDEYESRLDNSPNLSFFSNQTFGVAGVAQPLRQETTKLTQELRAQIPIGEKADWLWGAFYTDEDRDFTYTFLAVDPQTGSTAGTMMTDVRPVTYEERALFTNLTLHLTKKLDLQLGGRIGENEQTFSTARTGPIASIFYGSNPSVIPEKTSGDNVFTYLVTPTFKVSPDLMVYARFASGYRPGGPNAGCGVVGIPCDYDPDETTTYELGTKGSVFDGRLAFDASLYRTDWEDVQLTALIRQPVILTYIDNASEAKSEGLELSVDVRPWAGMEVSAWAAWSEAELTKDVATGFLVASRGDRLPYSSRFSGSISLSQAFHLTDDMTISVGGAANFVGDRMGLIQGTRARQTFPSYTLVDAHATLSYRTWSFNAFVNNLSDRRGVLRAGADAYRPTYFNYVQPRTIGITLTKSF